MWPCQVHLSNHFVTSFRFLSSNDFRNQQNSTYDYYKRQQSAILPWKVHMHLATSYSFPKYSFLLTPVLKICLKRLFINSQLCLILLILNFFPHWSHGNIGARELALRPGSKPCTQLGWHSVFSLPHPVYDGGTTIIWNSYSRGSQPTGLNGPFHRDHISDISSMSR